MNRLLATFVIGIAVLPALDAQNLAASFDGTGSGWIQVPHDDTLVPAGGITVEAWVYRTFTSGQHRAIVRKNSSYLSESYNLRISSGTIDWILKTQVNGTIQMSTNTTLPMNSWHHLAGTFDNSVARVYLDGVQVAQSTNLTGPLLNTGDPLKIGNGDSEPWGGLIDNVRIWGVARTQAQIQQTMASQTSAGPGLIATWRLNGDFLDSTGTHHGVPAGAVPFAPGPPLVGFLTAPLISPVGSPLVFGVNNQVGGVPYALDISITGTSPGITIGPGLVIPLNPPFLNYDTGAALTNIFVNFFGILDAAGHASPWVNVPLVPALAGTVVSATFVALNPAGPQLIDFIAPATQTTLAGAAPVVGAVMPPTGPTTGGSAVIINGSHFQSGATVTIGGAAATSVFVFNPTQLTCFIPPGSLGPKTVTITNPDGVSGSASNAFTYVTPLALTQVAPLVAAPGVTILLTGNGFQPGSTLTVGGSPVTPSSLSATQISFANPAGVPCGGPIQVTTPDTQSASIAFNPSPTVTLLVPATGPAAGGNSISIVGTNFWPGTTVKVNGNPVPATVLGTTLISVTMPAGAAGPAQVTVSSINNCSGTGAYTYQ